MNKKKILYIHHGKGLGGAPLSLLYLIENLDKNKYIPEVLFLHDSDAFSLYKSKNIKTYGPINLMDFSHTKIFWYRWYNFYKFLKVVLDNIKTFKIANNYLNKIKPDIIHLNTSSLIIWGKVANKKNIPVVWHVREPLASGYLGLRKKVVTYFVKKYSTKILPICKNDAKPWLNNPKLEIVYNAVDSKIFTKNISLDTITLQSLGMSASYKKILFLGGLSREKGTLEILEIFKELLKILPEVKLIIAGYFDLKFKLSPAQIYKNKIKNILKDIQENIIFTGINNNIPELIKSCNLLVFPATQGHFARPIIEAGFMAKPIIASNLLPLNELVIDNQTGFLIDIKDKNLWVNKLNLLLTDKILAQKMGENNFDFCSKQFNIKDHIKKIEMIYESIL